MSPSTGGFVPHAAGTFLQDQGIIPEGATPEVRPLGGGVSNHVVEVRWGDDCLVAKQPRPNLAVEDDWPADVTRVHNEAAAARAYAAVIHDAGLAARTPAVRYEDETEHVIGLECAPVGATMWKGELLEGTVDLDVARAVGRLLGTVHDHTADDEALHRRFASKRPFHQLRLDPYHRTTAERHPDVGAAIRAEVERIAGVERTLVHGDYSPKNVLVDRSTAMVPWILDFEVAHWGDPAFDTAFMLNHLLIKSIYRHGDQGAYLDAAFAFWTAYEDTVPWNIETETMRELGILMLARVDGKSPVEYVDEGPIADVLRTVAKRAITEPVETLEAFASVARSEAADL